jgi:hypothetical protein
MSEGRVRRRNPNEEWNFGNRKLLITIYSTAKCPHERTTNAQSDLDVPDYTLLNLAHERAIPLPPRLRHKKPRHYRSAPSAKRRKVIHPVLA